MSLNKENYLDTVPLWEKDLIIPLLASLKLAPGTAEFVKLTHAPSSYSEDHNPSGLPLYCPSYPTSQKSLQCSHCQTTFATREEQISHYSLDWHRFNLKRSIDGFSSVSQEQFINKKQQEEENKQNSHDSSTEEEEFNDEEDTVIQRRPRIFFVNADSDVISIYRTVLHHKKTEICSEAELLQRVFGAPRKLYWTIILAGGGHFAAAVFHGEDVVAHKTFHSYSVRAKQGKAQSSRDNKNATSHPRSAGASLRRYNEQAHNQHVQELLGEWKEHITKCNLIFFKFPKSSALLFGGQNPILVKTDERLRTIPFPTKKPAFAEVRKVHKTLSHIYVHGKLDNFVELEAPKSPSKKMTSSASNVLKKAEKVPKKLSKDEMAERDTYPVSFLGQSSSDEDVDQLVFSFEELSTSHLQPFGSSVEERRKKRKSKKTVTAKSGQPMTRSGSSDDEDSSTEIKKVENFIYTSCRTGNLINLQAIHQLSKFRDFTEVPDVIPTVVLESLMGIEQENFDLLNLKFGTHEKTLLHVAAENAHKDLMWWLLDQGCDPAIVNKNNETPYIATKVKEARNHFRRYVAAHPHKYDYEKAKIPGPLTEELENAQKAKQTAKKQQQKRKKQEKEKELKKNEEKKQKEREKKQKEKEEKEKFLQLSDREKRALAAEKRMQATQEAESAKSSMLLRCFQCAKDITKMVPFEYSDFKFCSTVCVREHRIKGKQL